MKLITPESAERWLSASGKGNKSYQLSASASAAQTVTYDEYHSQLHFNSFKTVVYITSERPGFKSTQFVFKFL